MNGEQVVESAWRDQAMWSEVANRLKADLSRWRYRVAIASVLGAFLETLASSLSGLGDGWWWLRTLLALLGAVILAIVPYVLRTKVSKDSLRDWVQARSASEGLKELIYRYLLAAPPFEPTSTPADLIKHCQTSKEKIQSLAIHAVSILPPPRNRPLKLTVEEYIEKRLNDQIENYYRPKGRDKALKAQKLHILEFALGLLAVVIGTMASAAAATGFTQLSLLGPWVAVVTTAGAAVTAHLAASRYDHEAIIYFGTADRLTSLRDEWLVRPNRLELSSIPKFVDECEHAISTENEAWLAEWTRDKPKNEAQP